MALKMEPKTVARLYLVIGIVGVFLVVTDVALIIVSPGMLAPYFTAFAGLCFVFVAVVARRAIRKANRLR
ncbi:hypothetical protein AX769_21895 (plasmid) [Frondihabitans sp. PAMC 28766]|uniref:hypothetical protein n=1 Tax=Frondihabitans sp. PAMC 28766 TaxID=1795630 RepID=UPI00078EC4E2|nr:hypothetical protein [Frondihabitans sp. PAMC 28766]AMM22792.1 hypothetical protein AX769_21895 [Frondihabitans sp. PAMC 28766]